MAKDNLRKDGKVVGQVTTNGVYGFIVGKSLGNARVEPQYAKAGQELELEHQGKRTTVVVTSRRLYDPEGKKLKA
jgi:glycine cleavage system aminomethyltransferase T